MTDGKQDELLTQWSNWGEKLNKFSTDNYVTKDEIKQINNTVTNNSLQFASNATKLEEIGKNMNNQRGRNQEIERKIESKLDTTEFDNKLGENQTIKQIQQNLSSKLSSQNLIPISQNVDRLDGLVNKNTENIYELNKQKKIDIDRINTNINKANKENITIKEDILDLRSLIDNKIERDIESKLDTKEFDNKLGENQTIKQIQKSVACK